MATVTNRGLELRVKGHLYEIQEINDEIIEGRQGYPMSEFGYERTLMSVADCADENVIDEVANYIKNQIEANGERPKNRKVRRVARSRVSDAGYPANNYLNTA